VKYCQFVRAYEFYKLYKSYLIKQAIEKSNIIKYINTQIKKIIWLNNNDFQLQTTYIGWILDLINSE